MTTSTVSSMAANLRPKILSETLFVAREMVLMPPLVYNYAGTGMSTRYVGIYPTITAASVSEGQDFANATEWTKTQQMALTPSTKMAQVILTDERLATDPDGARQDASRELGASIATAIDTDLVDLFSGLDTDKGTAGSSLTIARCAAGLAVLRNSNVANPLQFVLHPYGWYDIWTELGQPAENKQFLGDTANQAMRDYAVGSFLGAGWYTSSNISEDSEDDAVSAVFHREALALDTRRAITIELERDASLRGWEVNATAWYAVGERRGTYGIGLTHDATEPTGT